MPAHLIVQASGAIVDLRFVLAIYVCDHEGTPVEGLQKGNFSIRQFGQSVEGADTINKVTEVNAEVPSLKMPGIYRLQTAEVFGVPLGRPLQFLFAIRVSSPRSLKEGVPLGPLQGFTTVPIVFLGQEKPDV